MIYNACDFFVLLFFSRDFEKFPNAGTTYVSCYERFAQLWELVKVNSNTRLWEEEMLNPLTGPDAGKIETKCCFLRHQYSTADWTKAAYSGEKKKCETRKTQKAYAISMSMMLWCCSCRAREIMCNNVANQYTNNFSNVLN